MSQMTIWHPFGELDLRYQLGSRTEYGRRQAAFWFDRSKHQSEFEDEQYSLPALYLHVRRLVVLHRLGLRCQLSKRYISDSTNYYHAWLDHIPEQDSDIISCFRRIDKFSEFLDT